MSADLMIICQEDDSSYEGKNLDLAFCIGECSIGEPHDEFSRWFQERYSGQLSMYERMHGIKGHNWKTFDKCDILAIEAAFNAKEHKDYVHWDKLEAWLHAHIGKHISMENW